MGLGTDPTSGSGLLGTRFPKNAFPWEGKGLPMAGASLAGVIKQEYPWFGNSGLCFLRRGDAGW